MLQGWAVGITAAVTLATGATAALPSCNECTEVMDAVLAFGENKTTVDELVQALEKECEGHTSGALEKVCDTLAESLEIFPELYHALDGLKWPNMGQAVCSTLIWSCKVDCYESDAPEQVRLGFAVPTGNQATPPYTVDWVARHVQGTEEVVYWRADQDEGSAVSAKALTRTYTVSVFFVVVFFFIFLSLWFLRIYMYIYIYIYRYRYAHACVI